MPYFSKQFKHLSFLVYKPYPVHDMMQQQRAHTHIYIMSSSNSNSVEERWVAENNKIFAGQLNVDIDDFECPCVFRAPKDLADSKPEAYTPQLLGLGPFHHQRLDLYTMQRKKLAAVIHFLGPDLMKKLEAAFLTLERSREYQIRASYHDRLDLSPQALAWIIAIDSVYLLLLLTGEDHEQNTNMSIDGKQLAADVLMLENQIPATFVLWTLMELSLQTPQRLGDLVFNFCLNESPLGLKKMQIVTAVWKRKGHILSMMYYSILDLNPVTFDQSPARDELKTGDVDDISIHPPGHSITVRKTSTRKTPTVDPPPTGLDQIDTAISVFDKIWRKLTGLFKSVDPDYEANRGMEEIRIPSVYQLQTNAGFKFGRLPGGGGIKEIEFEEREKKLLLPCLKLSSNSEVILRNLCAYEAAAYKSGLMGEYVDLMCGIVDTAQDVERLIQAGVISSNLDKKEIVAIFSGKMRKVRVDDKEATKSNIGRAIEGINRVYGKSRKVRTLRIVWKVVGQLRNLIIFLLILVVVFSLLLSAVCQIHNCQKL